MASALGIAPPVPALGAMAEAPEARVRGVGAMSAAELGAREIAEVAELGVRGQIQALGWLLRE